MKYNQERFACKHTCQTNNCHSFWECKFVDDSDYSFIITYLYEKRLDNLKLIKENYERNNRYELVNSIEQDINLIKEFVKDLKEYEN